jgi:DNA-directed RNA polymerase subunit F
MPSIEIIEETPLTLVEMKERLAKVEKRDKELNFRATKTKEYLNTFTKNEELKKSEELKNKIKELNIPRLKDRQIVKIVDIMPQDMDGLKIIFVGENITVKNEDLEKILQVIK